MAVVACYCFTNSFSYLFSVAKIVVDCFLLLTYCSKVGIVDAFVRMNIGRANVAMLQCSNVAMWSKVLWPAKHGMLLRSIGLKFWPNILTTFNRRRPPPTSPKNIHIIIDRFSSSKQLIPNTHTTEHCKKCRKIVAE